MSRNTFLEIPDMVSMVTMEEETSADHRPTVVYYPSVHWMNQHVVFEVLKLLKEYKNPKIVLVARHNWGLHILAKYPNRTFQRHCEKGDVTLSTIHAAKGGQWDAVFILHLRRNSFPDPRSSIEEEWRLFFEAVTRPQYTLTLYSYAYDPSEFTFLLPQRLFRHQGTVMKVPSSMSSKTSSSTSLLPSGNPSLAQLMRNLHGSDYVNIKQFLPSLSGLSNPRNEERNKL